MHAVEMRDLGARYRYRGRVRADRTHTLCFECYRASLNRFRAKAGGAALAWREAPAPVRGRDVRDREALMSDLALRRRRAILNARRAIEGRPVARPGFSVERGMQGAGPTQALPSPSDRVLC